MTTVTDAVSTSAPRTPNPLARSVRGLGPHMSFGKEGAR